MSARPKPPPKGVPPKASRTIWGWQLVEKRRVRTWSPKGVLRAERARDAKGQSTGLFRQFHRNGAPAYSGNLVRGTWAPGIHTWWGPPSGRRSWTTFVISVPAIIARVEGTWSGRKWTFRFFDKAGHERGQKGKALDPALAKLDKKRKKTVSPQAKLAKLLQS
jgi:hypothetical protein